MANVPAAVRHRHAGFEPQVTGAICCTCENPARLPASATTAAPARRPACGLRCRGRPRRRPLIDHRECCGMERGSPVFCAIDTPSLEAAQKLAGELAGLVGGFKLGLEFFCANGPEGVRAIAASGAPIFLDLKLHDI